jgi:CubicO group peptidase (beta-lactamase class C family)
MLPGPGRKRAIRLSVLAAAVIGVMTVLVPAAAAASSASPGAVVGATTSTRITDYVRQQVSASRIPGAAVAIVHGDRTVLLQGFGNAAPGTSFFLASMSKSFTALAIMQLAGQGRVSLSAPVRRYIPWFRVGDGSQSDSMTVRELLDQTSGISTRAGLTELSFRPATTFQQAISGFERFPLIARPGRKFEYSDANYTIAGYIVQQVAGQSYDSYVRQHIFVPLHMTHTYAVTGTPREPSLTRGYANWFGLKVPLTDQVAAPLVPAGYIISSAADMTHYLIAQMNGGVYDGTRIVSARVVREMHAALVPLGGQTFMPGTTSYGLGWGVGTADGTPVIEHDGQLRDFDDAMAILPRKNLAVVVLINEDPQVILNDEQIYDGILRGVITGEFPPVSHAYLFFYIIFDVIVVAALALMIHSLGRTGRWLGKFSRRVTRRGFWRAAICAVGADLATAGLITLAVMYGLGSVAGQVPLTLTELLFAAPDVTAFICVVVVFFLVRAVVRAAAIAARRKRLQPGRRRAGASAGIPVG